MDMTHGNPWGVPWDPGVGTMGAPWVGSLSLLGLKGPLGLLDPRASLDPRAAWHPREPRGQGAPGWILGCLEGVLERLLHGLRDPWDGSTVSDPPTPLRAWAVGRGKGRVLGS